MRETNLRNVSVQNIADNHSIAHSLLCVCNILILWGNLFYCVNIIIEKCKYSIPANEPFYIYIKSSELMD